MLDSSGSIGSSNFDEAKSFVKNITHYFKISQNSTRVAVMSYATFSFVHFPFSRKFVSRQDLHSAIDSIPYTGGDTNTAQALIRAYTDVFSGNNRSRTTGTKIVINNIILEFIVQNVILKLLSYHCHIKSKIGKERT